MPENALKTLDGSRVEDLRMKRTDRVLCVSREGGFPETVLVWSSFEDCTQQLV